MGKDREKNLRMIKREIGLIEFRPEYIDRSLLSDEIGRKLWRDHGQKLLVEFPSPKTENRWKLTSFGWVGYIPLTPALSIRLHAKVPLGNIFRMLEYAYRLKSFHLLEGVSNCQSLQEVFESLSKILARRILDRARKGFYRSYVSKCERLPFVRGRLEFEKTICSPWDVNPVCSFE